jgi:sugar lactone lactonase YvrE
MKFGTTGNGNSQFQNPTGITLDTSGNIYVADSSNNRIQKFDSQGNFLMQWGTIGDGSPGPENNGKFFFPSSAQADSKGNIYVSDSGNERVQKLDSDGNFLMKIG